MKILLISANTLTTPYPVYPIGLDHVAACIDARHRVRIEDLNALDGLNGLKHAIREFDPDLMGLSLRNIDNTDTTDPMGFMGNYRAVVESVRQASPAPVVLGGSGFTLFPRQVLGELGADFGIVGEGERLNLLLEALEQGRPPGDLPGVIVPGGDEAAFPPPWAGTRRARPAQPPRHLAWYLRHGAMLNLQTKRGCPFRCIYCTYPLIEGRRLRCTPPMEVARTAKALEAAGARYLYITDSSFNADVDHSLDVARAFRQVGLTISWGAFFTPHPMPDGYFETLAAAGLKHVEFGTDTLSDAVIRNYRKPFTADQVIDVHEAALAAGRHVAHYFLLGGPGETDRTLNETLNRIDRLQKTVLFFFCGMRIYPHTALHRQCIREGQLDPRADLLEPLFYRGAEITDDDIVHRVHRKAAGRANWVIGAGGEETAAIIKRMYAKGFSGPLWEYLIH